MANLSYKTLYRSRLKSDVTASGLAAMIRAMPAKLPPKAGHRIREQFARRLAAARLSAGYETMRDFAAALGVQEARYRRWEAAKTEPDLENLTRIAKITGVTLDILIAGQRLTGL